MLAELVLAFVLAASIPATEHVEQALIHEQNHDWLAAEQSYLAAIEDIELAENVYSLSLVDPLIAVGKARIQQENFSGAIEALRRAQHISHRHQGVHTLTQLPILEMLTEVHLAQGEPLDADQQQNFMLYVTQNYYSDDPENLLPAMDDLTLWYMETGQFHKARDNAEEALELIRSEYGQEDPRQIPILLELARIQRLILGACCSYREIRSMLDEVDESKFTPEALSSLYLELGDAYTSSSREGDAKESYQKAWSLMTPEQRGVAFETPEPIATARPLDNPTTSSKETYLIPEDHRFSVFDRRPARARDLMFLETLPPQDFTLAKLDDTRNVRIRDHADPNNLHEDEFTEMIGQPYQFVKKQLLIELPSSYKQDEEKLSQLVVTLDFTVDEEGDVKNIEVLTPDVPAKLVRVLRKSVQRTAFRPRMVDGAPVETEHVKIHQTFKS